MTDLDRLRDAVVQAARDVADTLKGGFIVCTKCGEQESTTDIDFASDLYAALAALDAHPAPRATAETVEVRAWVERSDSGQTIRVCGSSHDGGMTWHSAERVKPIAILSARVPLPAIPTIVADATLRLDTEAAG